MNEVAVREALASNLEALVGTHVSPWLLPNPHPPAAHIFADEREFDLAGSRGLDRLMLVVQVLTGTVESRGAQKRLAEYRAGSGPRSVKEKVEADPDLGGACQDLRVASVGPERLLTFDGKGPYLGCDFRVEVYG